jgi:dolichyl-phosphate-mannose--protein O-mannosyl transferase
MAFGKSVSDRRRTGNDKYFKSISMIIVCALATMIYCNSVAVFASTPDAGDSSDQVTQTQADVELEKHVTCGSTIKLTHAQTKAKLHSHGIGYGSGSGQQSVTGFPESNDPGGYWQIFGTVAEPCERGDDISDGQIIRLQHVNTRKWLHSHSAHRSPLTNNQEVSAHGDDAQSDAGDEWIFSADGAKVWMRDEKIRLQHRQTNAWLSCSNTKFQRPISGQSEVCGTSRQDANSIWKADQGVYFPKVEL